MAIYSIDTCALPPFGMEVELSVVVGVCAPLINEWIDKFENGLVIDGTEAFQYKMIEQIGKVGLGKDEWHPVWHVIVHPDNREGGSSSLSMCMTCCDSSFTMVGIGRASTLAQPRSPMAPRAIDGYRSTPR